MISKEIVVFQLYICMKARYCGSWKTQVPKKTAVHVQKRIHYPSTSNQSVSTDIAFLSLQLQTCRQTHLHPENWKTKC